jgi:hypothetical protein
MNNGVYTLLASNPSQISSATLIEFGIGIPGQKALVFSGIALPEMDTDDDADVGHPRVFVRLGRFVRRLVSSSVVTGLASVSNDESGFVLATDGVVAQRDGGSGELFLEIPCGLAGKGTSIHRIGYQAVCVVEEDIIRVAGEISWPNELHDASSDNPASIAALLNIRSGRMVTVQTDPPTPFGEAVWEAYNSGTVTGLSRRPEGWVATYEILNLPMLIPITVLVEVLPAFAKDRGNIVGFRVGGPDPVVLSGNVPEIDGVNFRLGPLHGPN